MDRVDKSRNEKGTKGDCEKGKGWICEEKRGQTNHVYFFMVNKSYEREFIMVRIRIHVHGILSLRVLYLCHRHHKAHALAASAC